MVLVKKNTTTTNKKIGQCRNGSCCYATVLNFCCHCNTNMDKSTQSCSFNTHACAITRCTHAHISHVTTVCWHLSLSCSFLHQFSLLTSRLTAIIQSNTQHSLITNLSTSASPVIRLEMIRAQLPYSRAARGLLVGYDCLDWLDSLATVMKYS